MQDDDHHLHLHHHYHPFDYSTSNYQVEPEAEPWPIPNAETMRLRLNFREAMLRETVDNRRIHITTGSCSRLGSNSNNGGGGGTGGGIMSSSSNNSGLDSMNDDDDDDDAGVGMGSMSGGDIMNMANNSSSNYYGPYQPHNNHGRNIMHVLHDRECRGPRRLTIPRLPPATDDDCLDRNSNRKGGDQSPSTVFDSPISTMGKSSTSLYKQSNNNNDAHEHHQLQVVQENNPAASPEDMAQTQPPPPSSSNNATNDPTATAATADGNNTGRGGGAHGNNNNKMLPRRESYPSCIQSEVRYFMETSSATKYHSAFLHHLGGDDVLDEHGNRPSSSKAVSTISIAFAPDAQTMASTHGDHTVKISCCSTGRLLQALEGHPRTPWTVKYHPSDAHIVASGCLGHQVRVWNWPDKTCLQMVRLEYAIISITFHPSGKLLAVANGTRLHFWGIMDHNNNNASSSLSNSNFAAAQQAPAGARMLGSSNPHRYQNNNNNIAPPPGAAGGGRAAAAAAAGANNNNNNNAAGAASNNNNNRSAAPPLSEMDQRHMLRCVHFPPDGKTIIIGGVNPTHEDLRRRSRISGSGGGGGGGMSFYLRLWDFDVELALRPQHDLTATGISVPRRAISNPRTFVPRALLYNDGGFDVSPDGKTLCACAEYWLPDGVENAMELVNQEELSYEAELKECEENNARNLQQSQQQHQQRHQSQQDPAVTAAETQSAVSQALNKLKRISADANRAPQGRSPSFRDSMGSPQHPQPQGGISTPNSLPRTPTAQYLAAPDYIPRTPENSSMPQAMRLSPPPPPGRRFGTANRPTTTTTTDSMDGGSNPGSASSSSTPGPAVDRGISTPPPPPPPPPPPAPGGVVNRTPHPLSMVTSTTYPDSVLQKGRYVPHVVVVSLDTSLLPEDVATKLPRGKPYAAVARGYRPRLGQLLEACPLDGAKASAVTCVKFSPSTDFCLIGYGVREPVVEGGGHFHPVTAVYRVRGGMTHVSTMLSGDDDVNIARFHPDSGHGFVYGTKQGRVRVMSCRPWMYYN